MANNASKRINLKLISGEIFCDHNAKVEDIGEETNDLKFTTVLNLFTRKMTFPDQFGSWGS